MKTIAVVNHKGGTGKTTFTCCISQALSLSGYKVLVIDNDSQHNLTTMLGAGNQSPNIQDVYSSSFKLLPKIFLKSIIQSNVDDLHVITAPKNLRNSDVVDTEILKKAMTMCHLERFYDYVIIDNAPGMDRLQTAAINAAHSIFIPTELKQFAIDGLLEMINEISANSGSSAVIEKIIPNFYKPTKRQNSFLAALNKLFPGMVSKTAIPADNVFDEIVTEGKILFINRLYSKGAAYYLKLMHEIFNLTEDEAWENMREKRQKQLSNEARKRYLNRKNDSIKK